MTRSPEEIEGEIEGDRRVDWRFQSFNGITYWRRWFKPIGVTVPQIENRIVHVAVHGSDLCAKCASGLFAFSKGDALVRSERTVGGSNL